MLSKEIECVALWYYLTKAILRDHTPTTNMLHRMTQGCVQGTQVIRKGEYEAQVTVLIKDRRGVVVVPVH